MNHIEQILAANEELVLAIEQMNIDVRPMRIGNVSFALEEAKEDTANQSKATVLEKLKALARRVWEWFKSFFVKKKEQQKETPLFDQEKFRKDMEATMKETEEKVKKAAAEAGAKFTSDLESLRARVKQAQANVAARNAQKPAEQTVTKTPTGYETNPEAEALWKKHILAGLPEHIRQQVRPLCGLITAFANGAKISHDSVRFADITAPIREFDNQVHALTENIIYLTNNVLKNIDNQSRMSEVLADIQESRAEIQKYAQKVADLGKVEPVAPQIDDVTINTVYRVAFDLSGKMPRSGIAWAVETAEQAMAKLNKAIEEMDHKDGAVNSDTMHSVKSMLTEVIVPLVSLVVRAADVVNNVFYSFQKIGTTIAQTAMNPNGMKEYPAFVADVAKAFGIAEADAQKLALEICKEQGNAFLYP